LQKGIEEPGGRAVHTGAMLQLRALPYVAVGGAIGAIARWAALDAADPDLLTEIVLGLNVVGSLLLGMLAGGTRWRNGRRPITENRYLLLGTGFCGGLTTFSTFALDVAVALDEGALQRAATFGLATPLLAVVAAGIGYRLASPRKAR
jgi:CrcB protein